MLIGSQINRGEKIVDSDGNITEKHAILINDLVESNNQDNPKNNFTASSAPAVTNNKNEGYTRGSEWIDSTGPTVYKLTSFTGTDAVWTALN